MSSATDTFAGSAGALTAPWVQGSPTGGTNLNQDGSGAALAAAINATAAAYQSIAAGQEQRSQVTVGSIAGGVDHYNGALVRASGSGGSFAGYVLEVQGTSTNLNLNLWQSGGYVATRNTWTITAPAATDVIEVRISADVDPIFTVFRNGVQVGSTYTDTVTATPPSGTGVGVMLFSGSSTSGNTVSYWEGGDITTTTVEQEGFRWREDDGSETTATWAAAQDTHINAAVSTTRRLRLLLNGTGDPASTQYRLDYKKSSDSVYEAVPTAQPSLSRAELTSGASTANAATYDTASVTLTAGRFYIIGINHSDTAPEEQATSIQTVGGAISFAFLDSQVFDTIASNVHRLEVWSVFAASTVTAALRITLPDAGTGCAWIVQEYTNAHAASPLGTPVKNAANASASISATPGALAASSSHQIAFGASDLNLTTDVASGTNWASVGTGVTYATPSTALECAENTSGTASQVTFSTAGSADRAVIVVEVKVAQKPILMAASANITASGQATTAQLTAPSGKTTSDFVAGRMQDDENPADAVDITADDYTEMEWSLTAVSGVAVDAEVYQFRVTKAGVALDTYSVTPQWTIGAGGGGGSTYLPLRRRRSYLRM